MECQRCGNQDKHYFVKVKEKIICRKCIMFRQSETKHYQLSKELEAEYTLDFELSPYQKKVSSKLLTLAQKGDCLLYAACGTGKTEIVLESIQYYLERKKRVLFAIPRKQVVIELWQRLSKIFKKLKVVKVCEGYTDEIYGDLIICTTHQLYRYQGYADLLILDEPDAYPYKGNKMLARFAKKACRGSIIYLTATPSKQLRKLPYVTLFKRFHGYPLLVPEKYVAINIFLFIRGLMFLQKHKRTLIFVPSKTIAKKLGNLFNIPYITSETTFNHHLIKKFKNQELEYLITTTILERGVTFSKVNILVLFADHKSFDLASLIQIAGRVGRDPQHPSGYGLFLCRKQTRKVDQCLKILRQMNV